MPCRPWSGQGPEPTVWCWPYGKEPVMRVFAAGQWQQATVRARQDWPDGRIVYQLTGDLRGTGGIHMSTYQWPQPGLRPARRGLVPPTR